MLLNGCFGGVQNKYVWLREYWLCFCDGVPRRRFENIYLRNAGLLFARLRLNDRLFVVNFTIPHSALCLTRTFIFKNILFVNRVVFSFKLFTREVLWFGYLNDTSILHISKGNIFMRELTLS